MYSFSQSCKNTATKDNNLKDKIENILISVSSTLSNIHNKTLYKMFITKSAHVEF